uniref:RRM domain-containing protein n=1 Tax=Ditylenchus dipsaci TaxID=166011 RepID=A0A915E328_9BILA
MKKYLEKKGFVLVAACDRWSTVRAKQLNSTELRHYVSNLSLSTTIESLTDFYSQFGGPLKVKLSQCLDRNLYYGVLDFSSQKQVDKAIQSLPHVVDGNKVVFEHNTKDFTLFAAELPPNSTQEVLQQYFEKFGPVFKCLVVSNKSSGDSAWVTYSSKQGLNLALANQLHKNVALILVTSRLQLLTKFGSVVNVNISHKIDTGYPTLYGYVTFSSPEDAFKFLLTDPHVVDGKEIKPPFFRANELLSVIPLELAQLHLLQNRWTLWYSKGDRAKNFEECLMPVCVFNSVEEFRA